VKQSYRFPASVGAALLAALALVAVSSCRKPDYLGSATLDLTIVQQPLGGYNVNAIACSFSGTALDPEVAAGQPLSESILVDCSWKTPLSRYVAPTFKWTLRDQLRTDTASFEAPPGGYLDNDYWLELSWQDSRGGHFLSSDTAQCRTG
jgi:hypothetical protein